MTMLVVGSPRPVLPPHKKWKRIKLEPPPTTICTRDPGVSMMATTMLAALLAVLALTGGGAPSSLESKLGHGHARPLC